MAGLEDELIKKFLSSETVDSIKTRLVSDGVKHTISIYVLSIALGKSVDDEDTVKQLVNALVGYLGENIDIKIMWAEGLLGFTRTQNH